MYWKKGKPTKAAVIEELDNAIFKPVFTCCKLTIEARCVLCSSKQRCYYLGTFNCRLGHKRSKNLTYRNFPVCATVSKLKSLELAKEFSFENFEVSNGWLDQWKKWFNVSLTYLFSMHLLSTSWKHQKTLRFSDVFRG